jgi:hypothetical protein
MFGKRYIGCMDKSRLQPRWIMFVMAIPISLYVSLLGTAFMGLCSAPSAISCWPHTFAWTLLAPSLLLARFSIRITAIVVAILLVAHFYIEAHFYGEDLVALWDTDQALDKCFIAAVFLLVVSALFPRKISN